MNHLLRSAIHDSAMMRHSMSQTMPVPPPMPLNTSVITSPSSGGIVHHLPPMPPNMVFPHPLPLPHTMMHHNSGMHQRRAWGPPYPSFPPPDRPRVPKRKLSGSMSSTPILRPTPRPACASPPPPPPRPPHQPSSSISFHPPPPRPPPPPPPPLPQTPLPKLPTKEKPKRIPPSTPSESELVIEEEIEKEEVERLLRECKAYVRIDSGKRCRSEVWLYMGRVILNGSGRECKEMVACKGCNQVYVYRSKSQGTSTLRHHHCDYTHIVKKQKRILDALKKAAEARENNYQPQKITERRRRHSLQIYPAECRGSSAEEFDDEDIRNLPWEQVADLFHIPSQGEGRHPQRELTPEGDDRKPVMPTPPPLKEHIMNSPSPQTVHPVSLHQGTPVSGGMGSGGLVNNVGGRSSSSVGGCASPPPPTSKDSPPQQLLCVRWGNFDSNIVSMFSKLRSQEHFVDVTLWCEGKTINCHKMILSACSLYFEKLLTEVPNPHPIIFLKDMRFWEIQALVEFMYRGEVSVHQEKLQSLLRAAESLQIKGLGSPSNDMGMPGIGDAQSSMDEDMGNSTMDMTTNSSHNNTTSHLHNHISMKDDNGPNSNSSNNSHSLHSSHPLLGAATNSSNRESPWQKFSLTASSNMMGIDLSNHGAAASGALSLSSLHGGNLPLPLSLSAGSPQSGSGSQGSGCGPASKRRKKETPRRIDLPRTAGMPLPAFNSTMGSEIEEDDDAASEDSMAAHERNHVDGLKVDLQHDQQYGDEEECDPQENYDENDQGVHCDDDVSSDHGEELDEDQDGALSLRVNSNLSDSERERSRKGNPIKKILGIGNNNNNNEGGPQNLIHNVSSGGD